MCGVQELLAPAACSRAEAFARCERELRQRSRAWQLVRLGLGPDVRAEAAALVLWHRVLHEAGPARRADLRAELERAVDGTPRTPLGTALAACIGRYALPPNLLRGPFLALEEDERVRTYPTRRELTRLVQRLAHPEGRLLLRVLGSAGEREEVLADALCGALMWTRWTTRLLGELDRGHLRVPSDELARHGVSPATLVEAPSAPEVRRLVAAQIAWTRALYARGWPLCQALGARRGTALAFALRWHAAALSALEARGCVPAHQAPRAGWLRVLACAGTSLSRRPPRLS